MRTGTKQRSWRAQIGLPVVIFGVVLVLGALGYTGVVMNREGTPGAKNDRPDTFLVHRGTFDMTILTNGELAALQQIEIRNQLESEATITEIVDEGKTVTKGDVLMRFADDQLQTKVKDAIDDVNVADAAAVAAKSKLDIAMKERESNVAKADLAIQLADLALMGWREGEDKSKRQQLQLDLETANKEYDRLVARYDASKLLVEKEYISKDELKIDEIEMIKAKSAAEQAQLAMEVYEKYDFLQQKAKKESDLEQAKAERDRVMQQADAEVRSAQSDLESKNYQLESKKDRLTRWQQQLSYCTVIAPAAGLVVYGSSLESNGWRNDGQPPQVGTKVSPNERVMVLPDTSRIVAVVKVNESISGQIQSGQRATVTSDAMPDSPLPGAVQSIGVLAESGGWRDPNRRDYTVKILLDGQNAWGLKPSMRCKAEVNVGQVVDSLYAPVQAVFRKQGVSLMYARDGSGWAEREVQTGQSSELYVGITNGLKDGDTVLLREPKPAEVTSRIQVKTQEGTADGTDESTGDGNAGAAGKDSGHRVKNGGASSTGREMKQAGEKQSSTEIKSADETVAKTDADGLDKKESAVSADPKSEVAEAKQPAADIKQPDQSSTQH